MYPDRLTVPEMLVLEAALAYDLAALSYDAWRWQWFWHQTETRVFDEAMASRFAGRRPDMLDVGCGTGFYLSHYRKRCARMVGVDPSEGMLAVAKHWVRDAEFYRGGLPHLPVDQGFELVVCARSLSHVGDLPAAAAELKRVTAAGGTLLLSDVDAGHPYEHTRLPTDDGDFVFARTCKHPRLEVAPVLEKAGFSVDSVCLIEAPSGEIYDVTRRDDGRPATGWVLAATG